MDKQIIYDKINLARKRRFLTNCYNLNIVETANDMWEYKECFIFSYDDHGINRLVYFTDKYDTINFLLDKINNGCYFLEFMTKNPEEYVPNRASLTARMLRLANPDCKSVFETNSSILKYQDNTIGERAQEVDITEINRIFWRTFHAEISHLLTDDELHERLDQITIHKQERRIDAILQANAMPKKFYINQVVNNTKPKIIHAMLLNRLQSYVEQGGKYLYAWVENRNIASLKFHKKYGMEHDGMYSMIYCIKR